MIGRKKKDKEPPYTVVIEYYGGPHDGHTKVVLTDLDPYDPQALPEEVEIYSVAETPDGIEKFYYRYTKGPVNRTSGTVAGYKAKYYYAGPRKDAPS